jgi:integrase
VKEYRHTFATLGLVHNVPVKVISEAPGHATVAITLDTYSHVTAGLRQDAMRHLDVLFAQAWHPERAV